MKVVLNHFMMVHGKPTVPDHKKGNEVSDDLGKILIEKRMAVPFKEKKGKK